MVRILINNQFDNDKRYIEAAGLSTDTKPGEGIITGSVFIELDTSTLYIYDEENSTWRAFE